MINLVKIESRDGVLNFLKADNILLISGKGNNFTVHYALGSEIGAISVDNSESRVILDAICKINEWRCSMRGQSMEGKLR